jgi:hypothetical protein
MSSSRSRPSGSSSSARKPTALTKPLTSEQIREKEHKEFLLALLQSHAGWLNKPIASQSDTIVMDITYTSSILGIVYFVFLLISPAFLSPHISALITLVIPVQCTVRTVVMEKVKDVKQSQNAPQWVFYWVIYVLWGMARGWISTFRPGYKAVFEVVRTVGLVVIGGPWFGRAGLVSPSCSLYGVMSYC